MNVIHIPHYDNPYQQLLIRHLEKVGVKAKFGSFLQFFSFLNFSIVYNVLKNKKVDVIHLHWQHKFLLGRNSVETIFKSLHFLIQIIVIRLLGIKLVWTVHNIKNHENEHEQLEMFFSGVLGRLANAVIAHCESSKRIICRTLNIPTTKTFVVLHGHYIDSYKNEINRKTARNILNLDNDEFVFLFIGRLRRYKGLELLVKSFLAVEEPKSRLIIAGKPDDGSTKRFLSEVAQQHANITIFDSYIADDDIQIFMNAADVLSLPYLDILTSGTAILAMSFAKPVIAPYIGCIPDILDSKGGVLYDHKQKDGLQIAIQRSLISKDLLANMGVRNIRVAHRLSWNKIALQTKKIYERC